jgi:hypothetical protein
MAAITSALVDHVGTEASQRMSAPCAFGSAEALRGLMNNAGFKDVQLRIDVLPMRVTALEAFLLGQFVASPIAADIDALNESTRVAFFDDIKRRLLPYMDDGGLAVPFEAHLVIAYR